MNTNGPGARSLPGILYVKNVTCAAVLVLFVRVVVVVVGGGGATVVAGALVIAAAIVVASVADEDITVLRPALAVLDCVYVAPSSARRFALSWVPVCACV